MKKTIFYSIVFLIILIIYKNNSNNLEKTNEWLKLQDSSNKEVKIYKKPTRVIVGTPLYAEIIIDLGSSSLIKGICDSKNNPEETLNIPKIGTPLNPNIEKIIELKPDLVVGFFGNYREKLEQALIPVFLAGQSKPPIGIINNINELFKTIEQIGKILDKTEEAAKLISEKKQFLNHIKETSVKYSKTSVAIVYMFDNQPPYIEGKETLANELLTYINAKNVFDDITSMQISFEELLYKNPDIIITDPSQAKTIRQNRITASLKAVKNNKIIEIPASKWTSSRIDDLLTSLIANIYKNDKKN